MNKKLSFKETLMIGSMLFGMFFGAGNLIFPIHMGQLSGSNVFAALAGFLVTGVGLPILGVAALGSSHSKDLTEMASRVGRGYGIAFTCVLYLTIGPLFAIPRCATTAFTVGFPAVSENKGLLLVFSAVFFVVVLLFSLKPGKIMVWIGKYLNPVFLLLFGTIIIIALIHPMAHVSEVIPDSAYETHVFFKGFLEGYNTMDALAGLAFGIVVVDSVCSLGVKDSGAIARSTIVSGLFCAVLMAVIYLGASVIGTQSRGNFEISANGGIALAQISEYYLGGVGKIFLALTVTLACLKTAIGLITSISKTFSQMFTGGKHYSSWAVGFTLFSFGVSNIGLNQLISFSVPVLQLLYPLAITLILLNLFGRFFGYDRCVFVCVTVFTFAAGILDFLKGVNILMFDKAASTFLPLYEDGLGWVTPAVVGLILGLVLRRFLTLSHNKQ